MNKPHPDLKAISPYMPQRPADPDATFQYDMLADALIWSDELPRCAEDGRYNMLGYLRPVWHYRASIIMGKPDERCRVYWEEAQELFPNWPGFAPARQQVDLAATLQKFRDATQKSLEVLDRLD